MKQKIITYLLLACLSFGALDVSAQQTHRKSSSKAKTTATTSKRKAQAKSKSSKKSKISVSPKKKESSADLKRQQADAQKDIARTREQIRANEAEVKKNLGELGRLEGDIDISKKKVAEAGSKVASLQKQIGTLESQIAKEEQTLAKMRSEYLHSVKKMQSKRREQSALAFIFSSKSFNQAMRRMRYLRQFSEWRKRQSAEIGRRVAQLKDQQTKLAQAKSACDKALATEVKARNDLQGQYMQQEAIVVELRKNGAALNSHLQKKQAEVNALKGRVASLIAEEQRKAEAEQREAEKRRQNEAKNEAVRKAAEEERRRAAEQLAQNTAADQAVNNSDKSAEKKTPEKKDQTKKKESVKKLEPTKSKEDAKKKAEVSYADARGRKSRTATPQVSPKPEPSPKPSQAPNAVTPKPAVTASASGFASMRGSLPHPVAGHFRVTSRFGRNSLPNMPEVTYDNPGIDAEVTLGANAQAVYAGKVSGVYMVPGYETVVIISHGDYYTVYGNITSPSVKVGDNVKQGQSVGRVGADENNPKQGMIHFEVWKKRDKTDPMSWLR